MKKIIYQIEGDKIDNIIFNVLKKHERDINRLKFRTSITNELIFEIILIILGVSYFTYLSNKKIKKNVDDINNRLNSINRELYGLHHDYSVLKEDIELIEERLDTRKK